MRITPFHRKKLISYLKQFYSFYPEEKYTVFDIVRFFKGRCRPKQKGKLIAGHKDAWSACVGETGSGKSFFTTMCFILFGRPFSLVKNIAYIPKGQEIANKFDKLAFQCLQVDEAAKEMRAVNWQSKKQQAVNVKAMTDRFKNNWVMLIMPNFAEFTKSMRRGSLLFRFVILFRDDKMARIVLYRKSRNFRSEDPWGDKQANKIYEVHEKKKREITNELMLNIERGLPNYVLDFMVPNLELILPNVTAEYDRLKLESREIEKEIDATNKPSLVAERNKRKYEALLTRAVQALVNNPLGIGKVQISRREIAKELNISLSTLKTYLTLDAEEIENPAKRRQRLIK